MLRAESLWPWARSGNPSPLKHEPGRCRGGGGQPAAAPLATDAASPHKALRSDTSPAPLDLVLALGAAGGGGRGSLEELDDGGRLLLELLEGVLGLLELGLQVLEQLVVVVLRLLQRVLEV